MGLYENTLRICLFSLKIHYWGVRPLDVLISRGIKLNSELMKQNLTQIWKDLRWYSCRSNFAVDKQILKEIPVNSNHCLMLLRSIQWNNSIKFPLEETLKCLDASQLWAHNHNQVHCWPFPYRGRLGHVSIHDYFQRILFKKKGVSWEH